MEKCSICECFKINCNTIGCEQTFCVDCANEENPTYEMFQNKPYCMDCFYTLIRMPLNNLKNNKKGRIFLEIDEKDCLKKTKELRELLRAIFQSYFGGNSLKLAKDIIFYDNFYANIFLTSSWIAHGDNLLKNIAHNIYTCSENLKIRLFGKSNADTDFKCAVHIIENRKIVNSMILMGKSIHKFFILRQKISFLLERASDHAYREKDNWSIAKQLIHGGERDLEDILQQYFFSAKTIRKIMNTDSFISTLKKAWCYYHEDMDIFEEDDSI